MFLQSQYEYILFRLYMVLIIRWLSGIILISFSEQNNMKYSYSCEGILYTVVIYQLAKVPVLHSLF